MIELKESYTKYVNCLIANCIKNFAVEILKYLAHISILKSQIQHFNPDVRMISNENSANAGS